MDVFDVIVVGAGPAGSIHASLLGKAGASVLLLDKAQFPRNKTCGDAFSKRCFPILSSLELLTAIEQAPHQKVGGIVVQSSRSGPIHIPVLSQDGPWGGYICRREYLDALFFEKAQKYTTVQQAFK